jgi:hypothetical protein
MAPSFDRLRPKERARFRPETTGGLPGGVRAAELLCLCDGRRTVAEIAGYLRGEYGSCDGRKLVKMFRLLERFGYVRFAAARPGRLRVAHMLGCTHATS